MVSATGFALFACQHSRHTSCFCFFFFLFGGSNLSLRVSAGGLGLSHSFVRQLVNRFIFLREQKKNKTFLRSFVQTKLRNALPEFIVSTSEDIGAGMRRYLKEVASADRFLSTRFSLEHFCGVTRAVNEGPV